MKIKSWGKERGEGRKLMENGGEIDATIDNSA